MATINHPLLPYRQFLSGLFQIENRHYTILTTSVVQVTIFAAVVGLVVTY